MTTYPTAAIREATAAKSTMAERAAAYVAKEMRIPDDVAPMVTYHLAAFAAEEVARVREIQRQHLGELAVGARVVASSKVRHNLTVAVLALDEATRPDARAKLDVNHKPIKPCDYRPLGGLSALARNARKGRGSR